MKKVLVILMSILIVGGIFIGCKDSSWGEDEATLYVQALLDSTYINKHDQAVNILEGITEEESKKHYKESLQTEADFLSGYLGIENVTDEINERMLEILDEIYSKSKYTVCKAEKIQKDRFLVKVKVEPMDIMILLTQNINNFQEEFDKKYEGVDKTTMSDSEFEAWYKEYDLDWANSILDILKEKISQIGYLDEVSFNVEVFLDENGLYDVSDDFYNIDTAIIKY